MKLMMALPMTVALLASVALLGGCGKPSTACNGHDALCARTYDAVAFPGTHDAYSNVANNFGAPDQTYTMTRQLDDGVRVLHLEMQQYLGDVYLCHSVCEIGSQLLADGLTEVATFAKAHPREVITLLMESSHVTRDQVATALDNAGLHDLLLAQAKGQPWPTLGTMIARGDRVVAFLADQTNTGGGEYATLLDRWGLTWETPWDNQTPADFQRCQLDRGTEGAPIYVVDTYMENLVVPTTTEAGWVNTNPFLDQRLMHCRAFAGKIPNFVMVDYYEVGALFEDVDALNGFAPLPDGDADAFAPTWLDDGGA